MSHARHSLNFSRGARLLLALFAMTGVAGAWAQANQWSPDKNVEIVVGAAPGGSGDKTARLIQKVFKDDQLVKASVSIVNKAGGGGTISRIYLNQHAGDAHYISIAPLNIITNYINGVSKLSYEDLTPLAHLYDEYIAFAVRADSPIRSGRDLTDQLKQKPESVVIAIATALGNPNHIATALVAKAAGGDVKRLKTVVFNSSGEASTALLGGHVDLVPSSIPVLLPLFRSGKIRLIGVTSGRRLSGVMANTPTWKEQGADVVFGSWRGIIGPKDLGAGQIAYWDHVLSRLSQSPEWEKELTSNYWVNSYRSSKDAKSYWAEQSGELSSVLTGIGLAKNK